MTLKAKNIVENRFWIIENEKGERIGNIAQTTSGVRCTVDDAVEVFPNMSEMAEKKNISIIRKTTELKNKTKETEVYGYPTNYSTFNQIWNVKLKLPLYTKNSKSSSFFAAGYYIVKFDKNWMAVDCPKLITLQRYAYYGPFKTKIEQSEKLRTITNETAKYTLDS
jgi:hypothetical protein